MFDSALHWQRRELELRVFLATDEYIRSRDHERKGIFGAAAMTIDPEYLKAIKDAATGGEMYRDTQIKFVAERFGKSEAEVRAEVEKLRALGGGGNGKPKQDEYQKEFQIYAATPDPARSARFKNFVKFAKQHGVDQAMLKKQVKEYDATIGAKRLKTVAEFFAEYKPLNYVIEPIIDAGGLYTLTGKTGSCKTAWLILASISIAMRAAIRCEIPLSRAAWPSLPARIQETFVCG